MLYKQKSSESPFEGGLGDDPSVLKANILIYLSPFYLILDFSQPLEPVPNTFGEVQNFSLPEIRGVSDVVL